MNTSNFKIEHTSTASIPKSILEQLKTEVKNFKPRTSNIGAIELDGSDTYPDYVIVKFKTIQNNSSTTTSTNPAGAMPSHVSKTTTTTTNYSTAVVGSGDVIFPIKDKILDTPYAYTKEIKKGFFCGNGQIYEINSTRKELELINITNGQNDQILKENMKMGINSKYPIVIKANYILFASAEGIVRVELK